MNFDSPLPPAGEGPAHSGDPAEWLHSGRTPHGSPNEIPDETLTVTTVVIEERTVVLVKSHHVLSRQLLDRARSLLSLLTIAVFVLTFIFQPFRIPSESMERTMLVGDFVLVNKATYGPAGHWGWLLPYRHPREGDVVVFRFPLNAEEDVVKRVVGSPGDHIHLLDGVVYRNGQALAEPYTKQRPDARPSEPDDFRDNFPSSRFTDPGVDAHWWTLLQRGGSATGGVLVPSRDYFVMGDNRDHSRDSRYWGFVPEGNLIGMPMLIYFSVREPSRTDPPLPPDDRLGKSMRSQLLDYARWDRILRVVR